MKNYKKVQMVAKNAPTGSYAAGCPSQKRGYSTVLFAFSSCGEQDNCINCERTN